MTDVDPELVCRRRGRLVRANRDNYEFEHDLSGPDTDPDGDCGVPRCPSAPAARHRDRMVVAVRAATVDG